MQISTGCQAGADTLLRNPGMGLVMWMEVATGLYPQARETAESAFSGSVVVHDLAHVLDAHACIVHPLA